MFERIRSLLVKEFLQVLRDPRMRTVIFLSPLIQVIIFGYAANTDIHNIPTAVCDLDNTPQSREVVRDFEYSKYFKIKYYLKTIGEEKELINRSRINVVIHIDRGFGRDLMGNKNARLQLIVDGTDSNTADVVMGYANTIISRYSKRALKNRMHVFLEKKVAYPSVDLRDRAWFNDNLESKNYYIPGVMASIVTVVTLLLTSMAIVREKEIGTMEQLVVSPLRPFELIIGKVTPFAIIALADVIFITTIGVLWFNIPIRGNLLLLFGSTLIYLLTSLGVGLFISSISATQQEAAMSTFLFFFPVSLLSGFMFPIINMPKVVQYLTLFNPLRYFLVIIRSVFLKGVGIRILWEEILILLIMGIAVLIFSTVQFKKRLD